MSESIERVENLIRVVSAVRDDRFDICQWYSQRTKCGCAIGHAMQDAYFVARRFYSPFISLGYWDDIAAYFDIDVERAKALFVRHVGYETRRDVLTALRVLLLEKMAQELPAQLEEWGGLTVAELELV